MKKQLLPLILILLTHFVNAQPKSFNVKVYGNGHPIILIPGYSISGEVWNGTVNKLKSKYRLHVLTLAGFAGQPAPDTSRVKKSKK